MKRSSASSPVRTVHRLRSGGSSTTEICLASAFLLSFGAGAEAVPTKEDSGWVSIFNGKDFSNGFYVYSKAYIDIKDQTRFKVEDGMIHAGGSYALLMTVKEYAYYRVRVDYMFGAGAKENANAGLMVLMDNEQAKVVKVDTRPRSIEVNCRRDNNYPWSLWAGRDFGPYITTTVKKGTDQYLAKEEGGEPFTFNITEDNNRVVRSTYPNTDKPVGQWNHGEARVYGDSGVFYLNGQLRTAGWNWVIRKDGQSIKVASGGVGVQTEGSDIWYRNWEIQELDPVTRIPIHATRGCTDSKSPRFNPRAVVEDGSCAGAVVIGTRGNRSGGAVQPLFLLGGSSPRAFPGTRPPTGLRALDGRLIPMTRAGTGTGPGPASGFYTQGVLP